MCREVKGSGCYLGTEIGGIWWKRYLKDGMMARGNGEYWYDDSGFFFLRYLTSNPLFIPFKEMVRLEVGKWHAGRWCAGRPILKIVWQKDGQRLSSGFLIHRDELPKVLHDLELRAKDLGSDS